MAKKEFSATCSSDFQGNKIPEIKFNYEAEVYDSYDAVPVEEKLSVKDMLQAVNASNKAAARAKQTAVVLTNAGYKKPDPNDPATIRENTIKLYQKMFPGLSEENARKMLEATEASAKALATA